MNRLAIAALAAGLLSGACATSIRMPALRPDSAWGASSAWTPPEGFATVPARGYRLRKEEAGPITRISLTTHAPVYLGWVQPPQVPWFVQFEGQAGRDPAIVGLLFRTLEPQTVLGNQLVFDCSGVADTGRVVPHSELEHGGSVASHFLIYRVPIEHAAGFAACDAGKMVVGQIEVPFTRDQFTSLQSLLRASR